MITTEYLQQKIAEYNANSQNLLAQAEQHATAREAALANAHANQGAALAMQQMLSEMTGTPEAPETADAVEDKQPEEVGDAPVEEAPAPRIAGKKAARK